MSCPCLVPIFSLSETWSSTLKPWVLLESFFTIDNFDGQVVLTKSSGEMAKKLQAENIYVKVVDDLAVGVEMHSMNVVAIRV